ncbi:MAG TPA: sterol desaturase family protein [Oligoflexus sp.]|uniref:sterol desaturase family protein n=1 Tax=Oligoflexus sp. TaxID=1971216 RepID=UPI002D490E49|nr:sterol desaturase family protein [Oligoflexus sp.]HYX37369.1 sterol desaturase family protein [Oligoflexus sp.]
MTGLSQVGDWLKDNLAQSLNLASPFCPLYLVPAFVIGLVWLGRSQTWSLTQAWHYGKSLCWEHRRSIQEDGLWALFQILVLRAPVSLLHLALFQWSYEGLVNWGGDEAVGWYAPQFFEALLATAATMLAIDFAAYGMHRALHSLPGLWCVHRWHHQARFLTPFSTLRQHPLEPFLLNGARGLAAGISLGAVHLLFPNSTAVWTMAGMGLGFFLYMFTVNLHHAPIPVRYPASWRTVLISPHIHHIHHSKALEHHGKNFGVVFSFWDRWFGTYWDQEVGLGELEFGVEG